MKPRSVAFLLGVRRLNSFVNKSTWATVTHIMIVRTSDVNQTQRMTFQYEDVSEPFRENVFQVLVRAHVTNRNGKVQFILSTANLN